MEGRERLHPMTLPNVMMSGTGSRIAIKLGLRGPGFSVSSACASGLHAIMQAAGIVASGQADIMVAGGAEAPFALGALKSWEAVRVMSPTRSRPFAADRDGMTLAEGAAIVVLEEEQHASRRGAELYAEVLGYGMTCDASDMLAPDAAGMADAMRLAMEAGQGARASAVIAHGTGTKANDEAELTALHTVFRQERLPALHFLKGHVGHMLGASGALNAAVAAIAVRQGYVPGDSSRLGGDGAAKGSPSSGCADRFTVLANAFAFGGLNAAVLFGSTEIAP